MKKRIGFVSTRIAGTDGVSLETFKWYQVLERNGYECFFFAGELDTPDERSFLEPKAHFDDPDIESIQRECFGVTTRTASMTRRIHSLREHLKESLYKFKAEFEIDLLIPENALAIPMNLPLGLAITEFVAETGIRTIAHHHDFSWERRRFLISAVEDYIHFAFPPTLPHVRHVTINSAASRELSYRRGLSNEIIPNVFDFANPPKEIDGGKKLRGELGYGNDDLFILQPTRIVPRKWIERAVELVGLMKLPNPRLVISHKADDEGAQYVKRILEYADRLNVELVLIGDTVGSSHCFKINHNREYAIDDAYSAADLITYPSGYEGFGNAFVEAIYFKKPIVVNRYAIFVEDIEPMGFHVIDFDSFVTHQTVERIQHFLHSEIRGKWLEENYRIGRNRFSYEVLESKLTPLIESFD